MVINYCSLSRAAGRVGGSREGAVGHARVEQARQAIVSYGRAVRIVRAARGFSQKELASRAHVDPSYVSLLESEKRDPGVATVERLADALGVPPHLLSLLAAEETDLAHVSQDGAGTIAQHLLAALIVAPPVRRRSQIARTRRGRA